VNRLKEIRYFSATEDTIPSKTVNFYYNSVGKLVGYNDGTISADYIYDDSYRKISESIEYGSFGLVYSYQYYKNGKKKSFSGPGGIRYEYSYDDNNQLINISIPGKGNITYNSYTWSNPDTVTLPGGTKKEYLYNPVTKPTKIAVRDPAQNLIMEYHYGYDKMDNVLDQQTERGDHSYGYDEIYQISSVNSSVIEDKTYLYDAVGNRVEESGVTGPWSYNANNELLGFGSVTFEYDDNGNMVSRSGDGDVLTFNYDIENRLASIENEHGVTVAEYYYDPFGRRLWKDIGGVKTFFLYSDEGIIGEYNQNGDEIKTYGYKPNSIWTTDPLFMKIGNDYFFYQNDRLGTPVYLTSINGSIVWSAVYEAYGRGVVEGSSEIDNNLRLPGQYYDSETGLHYNYYRSYDPRIGRYIETDPLGSKGKTNSLNYLIESACPARAYNINSMLYGYVKNNPINYLDPFGTFSINPVGGGFCFPVAPPVGLGFSASYSYKSCCDRSGTIRRIHVANLCLGVCSVGSTRGHGLGAGGSIGPIGNCPEGRGGSFSLCGGCSIPGVSCQLCVSIPSFSPSFGCSFGFYGAGCSVDACLEFPL